jgi:hypothetical protein
VPDDPPQVGNDDDNDDPTGPEPTEPPPPPSTKDPALAAARREAANYRRQLREREAELTTLRNASKTDQEKAIDAAKAEAKAAADTAWQTRYHAAVVRSEALTALAGRVASPKLALPHLPLTDIEVNDDGTVDSAALTAAIDALLVEYPELATGPSRTTHHADQGAKKPSPGKDSGHDPNALLRYALTGRRPST